MTHNCAVTMSKHLCENCVNASITGVDIICFFYIIICLYPSKGLKLKVLESYFSFYF